VLTFLIKSSLLDYALYLDTVGVTGSNPVSRTIIIIDDFLFQRKLRPRGQTVAPLPVHNPFQSMKRTLPAKQRDEFIRHLKDRFGNHANRHRNLEWAPVQARLEADSAKLWSLHEMETTGGEPDVVGFDQKTGEYIFCDCSAESPKGRRSLCYDREALDKRKEHKPANSALDLAEAMGIELLTEEQYRSLQALEKFDTRTSSWLKTPPDVRRLGGAIFGDFRYGRVFIYHNGADSYYAARGFRGALRV
jgi:hypothetical protein